MRSEYVKSSIDEIEYMRKLGEWEDIPFIVKAEKKYEVFVNFIRNSWYLSRTADFGHELRNDYDGWSVKKDDLRIFTGRDEVIV